MNNIFTNVDQDNPLNWNLKSLICLALLVVAGYALPAMETNNLLFPTEISTCSIVVKGEHGKISITGLSGGAMSMITIVDKSGKTVHSRVKKGKSKATIKVGAGTYSVWVKIFDKTWKLICGADKTVVVGGAAGNANGNNGNANGNANGQGGDNGNNGNSGQGHDDKGDDGKGNGNANGNANGQGGDNGNNGNSGQGDDDKDDDGKGNGNANGQGGDNGNNGNSGQGDDDKGDDGKGNGNANGNANGQGNNGNNGNSGQGDDDKGDDGKGNGNANGNANGQGNNGNNGNSGQGDDDKGDDGKGNGNANGNANGQGNNGNNGNSGQGQTATTCTKTLFTIRNAGSCDVNLYLWKPTGDIFLKVLKAGASWRGTATAGDKYRAIDTKNDWAKLLFDQHTMVGCNQTWKISPNYCGAIGGNKGDNGKGRSAVMGTSNTHTKAVPLVAVAETSVMETEEEATIALASNKDLALSVFPNPASDQLTIELNGFNTQKGQGMLVNKYGQILQQFELGTNSSHQLQIDLSNYSNGLYYITLQLADGKIYTQKVLVQKL